ncbi:MAG: DUF255 domain-containing protein [Acidobacteria bacterium]|nr:DUF255 domain-containing protein [Acidobacteriota bacterium]
MPTLFRKYLTFLLLVLFSAAAAHAQTKAAAGKTIDLSKIKNTEAAKAFDDAKESEKLVLLVFGAVWCTYCRYIEEGAMQDAAVKRTLDGFVKVDIDVDENPDDAQLFDSRPASRGGSGIPAMVVFTPDGRELGRLLGYTTARPFNLFLKGTLKKRK